jgi:hypothetical protein
MLALKAGRAHVWLACCTMDDGPGLVTARLLIVTSNAPCYQSRALCREFAYAYMSSLHPMQKYLRQYSRNRSLQSIRGFPNRTDTSLTT